MAARKATTTRLELGEGPKRKFWEISLRGKTVTTHAGVHLSAGRSAEKEHASADAAKKAYDTAVAKKLAEGYAEIAPREVIGASSKKGVSVQNAELEAIIDEDRSDPERYLVYADWLQQQGDPRGELIIIQHGLAHKTDPNELDALDTAEAKLLKEFGKELLGKLAKATYVGNTHVSTRMLAWRYGFLRGARIGSKPREPAETAEMLFDTPSSRFLERLVFAPDNYDVAATRKALANAPQSLKTLVVGPDWAEIKALVPLIEALPQVRELVVMNMLRDELTADATRSIEELTVETGDWETLRSLATQPWPNVRRLTLNVVGIENDSAGRVAALFEALPALERATIGRRVSSPCDELASAIIGYAERRSVQHLELDMPVADAKLQQNPSVTTWTKTRAAHVDYRDLQAFHHAK